MRALPIHLEAGSDLRASLEHLAAVEGAQGFVLSVVGNLSQASFACPGLDEPTILQGELEIMTLQGTLSPQGVHLHLSFSDPDCQVWGGHLEHGTLVLKGADLLVGLLDPIAHAPESVAQAPSARVRVALADGCAWSRRTERLLQGLAIPYALIAETSGPLPQIQIDGQWIGGYNELTALHARGSLQALRHG
jgi:predicted DNA-binding protein with PD1-like motif/glutaredoxin